jgi:hypothetical protein
VRFGRRGVDFELFDEGNVNGIVFEDYLQGIGENLDFKSIKNPKMFSNFG